MRTTTNRPREISLIKFYSVCFTLLHRKMVTGITMKISKKKKKDVTLRGEPNVENMTTCEAL